MWEVGGRILPSPAYAGSHGCPSSAVVCYGGWIKPWRYAQRVFSDPSARAYGRRAEALAKEGPLNRAYVLLRNLRAKKDRRIGARTVRRGRIQSLGWNIKVHDSLEGATGEKAVCPIK